MNNDFMVYVDMRLAQWADWFSQENLYGIGFPSNSIEYRLMNEGCLINSTAPKILRSNIDAEEIETLVKEIGRMNRKIALALRSQYFGAKSSRQRAEILGMSYAQFRIFVDQGKFWLAGRLSASRLR